MITSWNLGVPQNPDAAVRSGAVDVVLLGRPALANPHWPVWAARELGVKEAFELVLLPSSLPGSRPARAADRPDPAATRSSSSMW